MARTAQPIVRYHKKHVAILCPMGHLIEAHELNKSFAGSALEAEIGALQAGQETRWHRLAAKCDGAGHEKGGAS